MSVYFTYSPGVFLVAVMTGVGGANMKFGRDCGADGRDGCAINVRGNKYQRGDNKTKTRRNKTEKNNNTKHFTPFVLSFTFLH